MNFYRKYRPQMVAELDLVAVREAMGRILKMGVVNHAYLFTGPKGTGKTSSARILAKIVHCEKNLVKLQATDNKKQPLNEPCNVCAACRAIMDGSHLGVVEMDAASNRGIDDIRTLRERIGLAPSQGNYTIYVIDEVHMLTTEAFNALLKTLEEPPPHAIFVLCTTEAHKVPETIVSRCTEIHFHKATLGEVKGCLKKAVTGEKLTVDEGVLDLIAISADGSFRDAMKTLEQGVDDTGVVHLEIVESFLGSGKQYDPQPLIQALFDHNLPLALQLVEEKYMAGVDIVLYGRRLVERLRAVLIEAVESGKGDVSSLMLLTDLMQKRVGEMKTSPVPVLPLEIAVVEWCSKAPRVKEPQTVPVTTKPEKPTKAKPEIEVKAPEKVSAHKPTRLVLLDEVLAKWPELLKLVKPLNHSLEALLRAAKPLEVDDKNWLTIEVFYTFHKEQLEQERYRTLLEKQCETLFQTPVRLAFVLGKAAEKAVKKLPEVVNVSGEVDEDLASAAEEIFS